jgi:hypothetical protein
MANETILRNGLIAKAASEVEGTLGVQGLQMLNSSNAVQYTFPTTDSTGNSGYALTTNGAGTLAFAAMPDISALLVNISSESIHDLSDVEAATGIADGDVLQWVAGNSQFEHVAASSIGVTTLALLTDTTITGAVDGDFLRHNGSDWVDSTIQNSDIAEGAVTQHQAALSILQSQITFSSTFLTAANLTGYATETYVDTAVSNLIDSAPGALDTLNELADALGDDADFAGTMTTALAGKAANGHTLTTHGDVTIAAVGTGELLQYTGSEWENRTLDEVGLSIDNLSNVSLGGVTTEDYVLAFNNANTLVPTSIGDLSTSDAVSTLTDVTLSGLATGELLVSTGATSWENKTAAEAGLATTSDIANIAKTTDNISVFADVTGIGSDGDILVNSGGSMTGVSTIGHDSITNFDTEVNALIGAATLGDLASGSITDLTEVSSIGTAGQILVSNGTTLDATSGVLWEQGSTAPGTDAATTCITEALVGGYAAITVEYSVSDATNMRMGQVMAITDGSTVEVTDISTAEIGGDTDEPVFSATTDGSNLLIKITDASGYTVKTAHIVVNG